MAEETMNQSASSSGAVIKAMHPHPFAYSIYYLGGLFIGIAGYSYGYLYALVGLFVLIVSEVMRRSETFTIFEEGVSRSSTLASRSPVFTGYTMIRSVVVTQSLFERVLGLGTITLAMSDPKEKSIQFSGVQDPHAIAEVIQSHLV